MATAALSKPSGAAKGRDHGAGRLCAGLGCGVDRGPIGTLPGRFRSWGSGVQHCLLPGFGLATIRNALCHGGDQQPAVVG